MDHFQPYFFMILSTFKNGDDYKPLYMALIIIAPMLYKMISNKSMYEIIQHFFESSSDIISINIPSHEIPIYRGLSTTPTIKNTYSKDFLSVIYYIMNYCANEINSITEIISDNKDLSNYYSENSDNDYIYIPISNKKILMCNKNKIYCQVNILESNNDEESNSANKFNKLKQKSYILTITTEYGNINIIRGFLKECNIIFEKSKIKSETDKKYIFVYDKCEKTDSNMEVLFNTFNMEHNKELNTNIFFENKDKLINYINPFIYNPEEITNISEERYKRSGFTFKAGLLFYGSPGCGKTSTIKAILKYTKRHGIVINLNRIKTCDELENIFRKRYFENREMSGKELCYILEDCDAISENSNSIIASRKKNNNLTNIDTLIDDSLNKREIIDNFISNIVKIPKSEPDDTVNLSCFLNILDGIIELHGVMVIMTTNYPDKIDDALIRPGRFDFKYEFKKASCKIIREMLKFKFELSELEMVKYDNILKIKDELLSPAQIQAICFQNSNIIDCINELVLFAQNIQS